MQNENKIRALHVAAGLDSSDGGPSYSVPRLCRSLAKVGTDVVLLSATRVSESISIYDDEFMDRRFPTYCGPVPFLSRLRFSAELTKELNVEASHANIIHNHGLWLIPNLQAAWAAARHKRPLIVTPRGMLSPAALAFSGVRKRMFWRLLQKAPVEAAACLHVTSEQEYNEVRAFGLTNPIAIIPNGIDIPKLMPRDRQPRTTGVVLSLGRIHPKKGLDRLLQAWAKVEPSKPNWHLRIIGPSEGGHDQELRALAGALRLRRVSIEGPVYGALKYEALSNADLFVLPTLGENFAMAAAEAMASGLPVISTKGAPWSGLEVEHCGWWIEHGVEPLVVALSSAMALPTEVLSTMGARGREWMIRDFGWDMIARKMKEVYEWVVGTADLPACVSRG